MKFEAVVYCPYTKDENVHWAVVETMLLVDRGMNPQVAMNQTAALWCVNPQDLRRYWNRIIRTEAWAYLAGRSSGIIV